MHGPFFIYSIKWSENTHSHTHNIKCARLFELLHDILHIQARWEVSLEPFFGQSFFIITFDFSQKKYTLHALHILILWVSKEKKACSLAVNRILYFKSMAYVIVGLCVCILFRLRVLCSPFLSSSSFFFLEINVMVRGKCEMKKERKKRKNQHAWLLVDHIYPGRETEKKIESANT